MSETLVTYELDGEVALIGLNRPEKRNAINEDVISNCATRSARQRRSHVRRDLRPWRQLLRRPGPARSAVPCDRTTAPPKKRRRHNWHEVFDMIARGPIPFVAALHGAVVGGGLELATAAHFASATRPASSACLKASAASSSVAAVPCASSAWSATP